MEKCLVDNLTAVIPISTSNIEDVKILNSLRNLSDRVRLEIILDGKDSFDLQGHLENALANKKLNISKSDSNSPGLARNLGLKKAKTELVTFWDCDDELDYEKINNLHFNEYSEVLCYQFAQINVKTNKRSVSNTHNKINLILNPGHWRLIYRASIIKFPFRNFVIGEDQVFLLENDIFNKNISFLDAIIYFYMSGNSNQITSSKKNIYQLKFPLFWIARNIFAKKFNIRIGIIVFIKMGVTFLKFRIKKN